MSADDRTSGRKTLLPDFLPAPAPGVALASRERVAERARVFLQRFRGLGTTAGAAVLSLQCSGYAVVDPLPPPPMQCTVAPDPFANIHVNGVFRTGNPTLPSFALMLYSNAYPPGNYVGFRIDAVRVTGGTLVSIDDQSQAGQGGGSRFEVVVTPASATGDIIVEVDLGCGAAAATKRYQVLYHVPASSNEVLIVTEVTSPVDAGTD